jgi:hypothetical protein
MAINNQKALTAAIRPDASKNKNQIETVLQKKLHLKQK